MSDLAMSLFQEGGRCEARRVSACYPMSQPSQLAGQRRKFSFPVSLQSNLLGIEKTQKRRFSNVSDAVSRKFSNTIGWNRAPPIPLKEIVAQGKTLCGQYIRSRLKRCGVLPRKCGLQRLRSAASLPGGYVVREVLPELVAIGQELERAHPKLYSGVLRQASHAPGPPSEKSLAATLAAVSKELMREEVSWPRIVSLYAVAGGLALDCVTQGHPEFLQVITEAMADAIDEDSALWIAENGGWTGLLSYCKPPSAEISLGGFLGLMGVIVACGLVLALLLRWFGRLAHVT